MPQMLNNKGFSNILVISIVLVLIGIGGYFGYSYLQKPSTLITETYKSNQEVVNQKSSDFSCSNTAEVADIFAKNLENLKFNTTKAEDFEQMPIRFSVSKPMQIYKPEFISQSEELNEKFLSTIPTIFKENINQKLISLGFELEFISNRNTDSWDFYQYSSGDTKIVVKLPSNREAKFTSNLLVIYCGKVNKKIQNNLDLVSSNFSKDTIIEYLDNQDKVLIISVYREGALQGGFSFFDISKNTPEAIRDDSGSESINCSSYKQRNIGRGLSCYDEDKKEVIESLKY
jgi:hypothetical protein